jgi:hypothetical protein
MPDSLFQPIEPGLFTPPSEGSKPPTLHRMVVEATWDPASVLDGASTHTTVTVPGAVIGDFALAALSDWGTEGDWHISAIVEAANIVRVAILNRTGITQDLPSQTLRVMVLHPLNVS